MSVVFSSTRRCL